MSARAGIVGYRRSGVPVGQLHQRSFCWVARVLVAWALVLGGCLIGGVAPLGGAVAHGQGQPRVTNLPDPASRQKVRTDSQGRRITMVDFDEARIEGQVRAPDGFVLRSRDSAKVESILELRKNFHRRIRAAGHEGLQSVPMR